MEFEERLVSFIEAKYDLILRKLQFNADLSLQNFVGSEDVIDFLCHKLGQGSDDIRIMVSQQIKRDLKTDLSMQSQEEFNDLFYDNGLVKIFHGVREELEHENKKRVLRLQHGKNSNIQCGKY